jgi:hypothetical protein
MSNVEPANPPASSPKRRGRIFAFVLTVFITAALCVAITALLMNIFQHKQEAKNPYLRFVDVTEETTDPAEWGKNWPREYDSYLRTVDATRTRYGGSEAMPEQKLDRDPWLKRMFAGYAFSIDYRDRRRSGHQAPAAGRVPALSRLGDPDVSANRGWGRDEGFRRGLRHDLSAGAGGDEKDPRWHAQHRTQRPPGFVRRLSRSENDGIARDPARIHQRHPRAGRIRCADAASAEHRKMAQRRPRSAV